MLTIEAVMLAALGFLIAVFAGLLILPAYKRRTIRLNTEAIKRSMPLTEAEIRADKDRLRADYVLSIHELESKLEKATLAHARQRVDINRRDAAISALEGELERLRASLEEHENAHRVLEQTIMDRLPRVEARLAEARRLVLQRDREIAQLSETADIQSRALQEAAQMNTKGRDELLRLNATLATRAARGRDSYGDDRQDGEVALRTELEALRAKSREQASMIARLQGLLGRTGSRVGLGGDKRADDGVAPNHVGGEEMPLAVYNADEEIARLRSELTEAEAMLRSVQTSADAGLENAARLDREIAKLRASNEDLQAELKTAHAEVAAYKEVESGDKALREGKTAMRAKIASLESQTAEQTGIIQRLRAEIASANERTARQAAHFTEELRRLGAGTYQTTASPQRSRFENSGRRSLSDRINEAGPAGDRSTESTTAVAEGVTDVRDMERASGFLKALGGSRGGGSAGGSRAEQEAVAKTAGEEASHPGARRGGLLERITRKQGSE